MSDLRHAGVCLATGVHLNYVDSGGRGDREPIVFLHGWPDSWFSFSRVLPLLSDNRRVIAVDQRGFGGSDRPEAGYAIADLADDIAAFLDALSVPRAVLAGHSFGSFVARRVGHAHADRISALVLIGTGYSAVNAVTRELQAALRDLPNPIPVDFAREFQASTVHHPVPPAFFERIIEESLKLPPHLWRVLIDRLLDYDDERQLPHITAPTLLLWGSEDTIFSREDQERLLATLPAAQLKVYEDTGHCPNWERPELVAADIEAFLGGVGRGSVGA
jgi:non-heme chloroperoxidase